MWWPYNASDCSSQCGSFDIQEVSSIIRCPRGGRVPLESDHTTFPRDCPGCWKFDVWALRGCYTESEHLFWITSDEDFIDGLEAVCEDGRSDGWSARVPTVRMIHRVGAKRCCTADSGNEEDG